MKSRSYPNNMRHRVFQGLLRSCLALAVAACTNAGAPNAPANVAISSASQIAEHSWIDSSATSGDLLYVSDEGSDVFVYSYPQGKPVGVLSGFIGPVGACVDPAGNVYFVSWASRSGGGSIITEFAHGGTTPIVTLQDPYAALGCAVDPKTGDLAVASGRALAIYADARGTPAIYSSTVYGFAYCAYDDNSNLFLSALDGDGTDLVRFAAGSNSFEEISLPVKLQSNDVQRSSVLWDGKYLALSSSFSNGRDIGPVSIYRFRVDGSKAKLISTATLTSRRNRYTSQFWLQGRSIVGTDYHRSQARVSTWRYPRGGKTQRVLVRFGQGEYGATVVSGLPSI
jgi:hypothetical protein